MLPRSKLRWEGGGGGGVAAILSNRAAAALALEDAPKALMDGLACVTVDPWYVKGYYRVVCALLSLLESPLVAADEEDDDGDDDGAGAGCERGGALLKAAAATVSFALHLSPGGSSLVALQKRIAALLAAQGRRESAAAAAVASGGKVRRSDEYIHERSAGLSFHSAPGGARAAGAGSGAGTGAGAGAGTGAGTGAGAGAGAGTGAGTRAGAGGDTEGGRSGVETGADSLQVVQMKNMMAEMMISSGKMTAVEAFNKLGFDRRIPPFHMDFLRTGLLPTGCDAARCREVLTVAYEYARSTGMLFSSLDAFPTMDTDPEAESNLNKRLHGVTREKLEWLMQAHSPGDVFPRPFADVRYPPHELHSFTNAKNRKENLTPGTTIVSVGFVDLGLLREANFSQPTSTAAASGRDVAGGWDGASRPARWVGYEATAYCVAKTAVVATMLQQGEEVDAVLQVWYSATWSRPTLLAFRRALTSLLVGGGGGAGARTGGAAAGGAMLGVSHPDVEALLVHWQTAEVSLATARAGWLDRLNTVLWRSVANFVEPADRHALCGYLLTGELLEGHVGSVVMFSLPPRYSGAMAREESMLHAIGFGDLMAARQHCDNVVDAAITHLRAGITRLSSMLRRGLLSIDVHLRAVEPSDGDVLASIAALDPHSITWSNVSDYYEPRDFHAMARACSGNNTVHHSYSMNWPSVVFGASFVDFRYAPQGHQALRELNTQASLLIGRIYSVMGGSKLLLCPPVDDSRNIIDYALFIAQRGQWTKAFFATAGMRDVTKQVLEVDPPQYSVFSRANSPVFYTFTYDPEIRFCSGS